MTRAELHRYAQEQDGCCKVAIVGNEFGEGKVELFPQDDELGDRPGIWMWTYYFTDEPDSFPWGHYGITE